MYFWNLTSQIGPIKHFYFTFDVFFLHRTADLWKNTKPIPFIKSEKKKLWTPLIINTVIITNPMRQWFEGIHHIRAPEKKCASDLQFSQLLSFSLFRFITNYFSIEGWRNWFDSSTLESKEAIECGGIALGSEKTHIDILFCAFSRFQFLFTSNFLLLTVALLSLLFTLNPFDSFQGRQTTYYMHRVHSDTFYSVCHSLYRYIEFFLPSFMSFVAATYRHFLWMYRLERIRS